MSVLTGSTTIELGTRVEWCGRRAVVVCIDFDSQALTLRYEGPGSAGGGVCLVLFSAVSGTRSFKILDLPAPNDRQLVPDLTLVSDEAWEAAYARERHLLEVATGFKSGDPNRALRWEPRPEYAPGTSVASRLRAKAAELDIGVSTIAGWRTNYFTSGKNPASLLDKRSTKRKLGWRRHTHPDWISIAREVVRAHAKEKQSGYTREMMRNHIDEIFVRRHPETPPPGRSTGMAALADLSAAKYTFASTATEQQALARDNTPHGGLHADYPTQLVLIDTHYLDVIGIDRLSGRCVPLQLTLLFDVFSKKVPALIVTEVSTDAFAVAQLLYRYFCPAARPDYMQKLGFLGVPREFVADEDKVEFPPERRPTISALIPDNAKVFIGKQTTAALLAMGTSLRPARVRTPEDKGPVERIFQTIEGQLLADEPGYRGSSQAKRGQNIEQQAFRPVDEIEHMICDYLAEYHDAEHDGFCLPDIPLLEKPTPNLVHSLGMLRSFGTRGLSVPADPDAPLHLLKVVWRVISHKGVEFKSKMFYKSEENLLPPPGAKSDTGWGKDLGKWPIRVNPWDLRTVILELGPHDRIVLTWVKAKYVDGPFTERTLEIAVQLLESDPLIVDLVQAINEVKRRLGAGVTDTPKERRAALEEMRRQYSSFNELGQPIFLPEEDERVSPSDADIDGEWLADETDDDESTTDDASETGTEDAVVDYTDFYARAAGTTHEFRSKADS